VCRRGGGRGGSRRFTGSYEDGSFDPAAMPTTSWIDDVPPEVDPATWRLVVADADGERELSLEQLFRPHAPRPRGRAPPRGRARPPPRRFSPPRRAPAGDPRLHQRLVRPPGLGGRAG